MNRLHIPAIYISILTGLVCFMMVSCRDELECPGQNEYVEPGLPATVTVRLDLPEMQVQSRTLTEAQESRVNDLWIGLYDAEPGAGGRLKDSYYISRGDEEGEHQIRTLKIENLKTTSGRCHIVAAANVSNTHGISSDNSLWDGNDDVHPTLLSMLKKADNIDKFKSIAAAIESTTQTDYSSANLVMGGTYLYTDQTTDGITHKPGYDWTQIPVVTIPAGDVRLVSGKIHMRRLVSKVTFKIKASSGITIRPTGWRLLNNPRACFLQEQKSGDGKPMNAGDIIISHLGDGDNSNYGDSYQTTEIELGGTDANGNKMDDNTYHFSFYTYENRRTATDRDDFKCDSYHKRESEYKSTEASDDIDNNYHYGNTGIYKALCADARIPDLKTGVNVDNFATMVEITCNVEYTVMDGTTEIRRSGTAVYTVHLGYMDNDPRDFNVRRNHQYIYSMTVLGLNQIVLEAYDESGSEPYPGIEGTVVDATAESVMLDAHYGMFNIKLTNSERARLRYMMESPYGSEIKTVEGWGESDHTRASEAPSETNEYYNWIRIKPTTCQEVFAEYKTSETDEPWYLHDLVVTGTDGKTLSYKGVDAKGNPDSGDVTDDSNELWYTVFVNENVYDVDGKDRHPLDDWLNYVNKDPRSVLFLVQDVKVSPDSESRYTKGKYRIQQRSIQTYYTTDRAAYGTSGTSTVAALGVEHVNESYGKKIDWYWSATSNNLSLNNGRWNQWKFLNNDLNNINDPKDGSSGAEASRSWYCQYKEISRKSTPNYGLLRYVDAGNGIATTRSGYIRADEDGYPVAAMAYYDYASGSRQYDPEGNVKGYYEAMALCMNRNRDLDGDGKISPNEVRWYLPAEGKYERIMLGRNSLVTPMFSVSDGGYYCNSNDPIAKAHNNFGYDGTIGVRWNPGNDNQVQYISSNRMKFFPEEGGSYNADIRAHWVTGQTGQGRYPWNIRCVRNLGVSVATINTNSNVDPVPKAYTVEYDSEKRAIFTQRFYFGASVRDALIDDYMPVHTVADLDKNRIARKFKMASVNVAVSFVRRDLWDTEKYGDLVDENGNPVEYESFEEALTDNVPCRNVNEEGAVWRAPNQRELMMMLNERVISGGEYSCTKDAYPTPTTNRFAAASTASGGQIQMNPAKDTDGSSIIWKRHATQPASGYFETRTETVGDKTVTYYVTPHPATVYVRCVRDLE